MRQSLRTTFVECRKAQLYNLTSMTTAVRDILLKIDQLDECGREELRMALRLRSRAEWERLAAPERERSAAEGTSEEDIDRAVHDVRYGKAS